LANAHEDTVFARISLLADTVFARVSIAEKPSGADGRLIG